MYKLKWWHLTKGKLKLKLRLNAFSQSANYCSICARLHCDFVVVVVTGSQLQPHPAQTCFTFPTCSHPNTPAVFFIFFFSCLDEEKQGEFRILLNVHKANVEARIHNLMIIGPNHCAT